MSLSKTLSSSISNMLSRGAVTLTNAAGKLQTLQVSLLANESKDAVEHLEPYGYTSHPLPGAEVLAAFIDGDRSHGVIIAASDRRYRVQALLPGEVAIYTHEGDSIILKNGHVIQMTTQTLTINATTKVEMTTPLLQITGGDVKADTISLKGHKHNGGSIGSGQTDVPA
jgi:phage baseplate assembly protein V